MEKDVLYVCGLTEWEKEEIKEHKGECRHCMHWDTLGSVNDFVNVCSKGHMIGEELRTDCKDWFLDTR